MPKVDISTKHVAINKANAQMVAVVAVASFITVFCLVASKAVLSQNQYQGRVSKAKEKAHQQLQKNIKAFDSLVVSYKAFDGTSTNVIGGNASGTGDNDGSNSKLILDALPSTYDFPALTSSLEKILHDQSLKIGSITGTDDQINQQSNSESSSPQPIAVPFSFTVNNANYSSVQQLIAKLQVSIRPIQVDKLTISGGANNMTLTVNGHTYFQPAKSLSITKQVVK
jgi:hypothetical protein